MGDFKALSRSGSVGEGRGSGRQGAGRVSTVAAGLSGIAQHSVAWLLFAAFGLSFPEAVILRKVLKPRLIIVFFGTVALGILIVGYLFNLVF